MQGTTWKVFLLGKQRILQGEAFAFGTLRLSLLCFVGHDCSGVIVACKAAAHTRPAVCQGLPALVLDAL